MNAAYSIIVTALLALSALPEGSTECTVERVPHSAGEEFAPSWIVAVSYTHLTLPTNREV